jgi:hypothetical protein
MQDHIGSIAPDRVFLLDWAEVVRSHDGKAPGSNPYAPPSTERRWPGLDSRGVAEDPELDGPG